VSGFSAEWLALREPADWRSRSPRVTETVARALSGGRVLRAVDLGAGTGSNARFLSQALAASAEWLLVDGDEQLLWRAQGQMGLEAEVRVANLSRFSVLREVTLSRNFVTASALLDLVSEPWLEALCALCSMERAAVLFALSYDGRISCSPEEPEDELVRRLVNLHQQTDKGFGPALGPEASAHAAMTLERLGYEVVRDRSDWMLDPASNDLQRQLIDGWAEAAAALAPSEAAVIASWRRRRLDHVANHRSRVVVGHEDLGAFIA
jgi:hypothetical protein